MELELISYTNDPIRTIIKGYRNCYQSQDKADSTEHLIGANDRKLIEYCIDRGHLSQLEHASFTFQFKISRAAQTQLIRHRISSFGIESQRYVQCQEYFIPVKVMENEEAYNLYQCEMKSILDTYAKLLKILPKEDARYILPNAMFGKIQYTANLKSLRHAISERTCKHAQTEIRMLFNEIRKIIEHICPTFVYKTEKFYRCIEHCGKCLPTYPENNGSQNV